MKPHGGEGLRLLRNLLGQDRLGTQERGNGPGISLGQISFLGAGGSGGRMSRVQTLSWSWVTQWEPGLEGNLS